MTATWQDMARTLRLGSKRKIACCSTDPSTYISNNERGISLGPCFRCGHKEWEPHKERSIHEILATRREADRMAAQVLPVIPRNSVPITKGPKEAHLWVLSGGLTPEQASQAFGMLWHEDSRRVLIPIRSGGRLRGILGRSVHGERPKYRMLGGPSDTTYALPKRGIPVRVVVEDILSAIAVWRAGANATAVLGTSVTDVQSAEIAEGVEHVIGWFDDDSAGDKAWTRLRHKMALYPVELHRITTEQDPKRLHRGHLKRLLGPYLGE